MFHKKESWRVEAGRLGGIRSGESRRKAKEQRILDEVEENFAEAILTEKAPETLVLKNILQEEFGKNISCINIIKLLSSPRTQAIIDKIKPLLTRDKSIAYQF